MRPTGDQNILASADHIIRRLKDLDVRIPQDCRLERARRHVASLSATRGPRADLQVVAEATRTIFEMYWISRALGDTVGPAGDILRGKLKDMLAGPDLPSDENDSSARARNTQFELFVGAWLTAGNVPVDLAEPDLHMEVLGAKVGLAAKRVRSRKTILQRIKRAVEQIERHTETGIIALNVDFLLGDLPQSTDEETLGRAFDEAFPEFEKGLRYVEARGSIRGLVFMGMQLWWAKGEELPQLQTSTFWKARFIPHTLGGAEEMLSWWEDFRKVQRERLRGF